MPLTNPWLAGPTPDRDLPRELLEERIMNLFSTHNTAVIATVLADGSPVATPVRYFSLGFEIFYTSWKTRRSPLSCGAIHVCRVAPLVGRATSRGAQARRRGLLGSRRQWRWSTGHLSRRRWRVRGPWR